MTLMAAYQTFLFRLTGETDILVGTPMANRNRAELENLVGLFRYHQESTVMKGFPTTKSPSNGW